MTLRRVSIALALALGMCVWAFAHSSDAPGPSLDPPIDNSHEALCRFRTNQSLHWRHVVVGNYTSNR
jgi:hypothetical protein